MLAAQPILRPVAVPWLPVCPFVCFMQSSGDPDGSAPGSPRASGVPARRLSPGKTTRLPEPYCNLKGAAGQEAASNLADGERAQFGSAW